MVFGRDWWADAVLIVCLLAVVLGVRVPIAADRKIMPAGDAFNLQHIASQIKYFHYPSKEKRLPFYPVLLLTGRALGFDPIRVSIVVSITASVLAVATLYILGRLLQLQRIPLLLMLGLSAFDPLLTLNGIRPLADSTFLFLICLSVLLCTYLLLKEKRSLRLALPVTGTVLSCMIFTRYEGILIAGLLLLVLFFRLTLKQLAVITAIPLILGLLWIPAYIKIHGSVSGLSYITDATDSSGGFGEIAKIPENVTRMLNGSGFRRAWNTPALELQEDPATQAGWRVISSSGWWVSMLALVGVIWLFASQRGKSAPIIVTILGYTLLLAWWWVYSRYVAPLSAFFYFSAAAGLSFILDFTQRIGNGRLPVKMASVSLFLLTCSAALILVWQEAPLLHHQSLAQSWENNGRGWALYQAITRHKKSGEKIALSSDQAVATLFFGYIDSPPERGNQGLGFYLNQYPDRSGQDIYEQLRQLQVKLLIETADDNRFPDVISQLKQGDNILSTEKITAMNHTTMQQETVLIHRLQWP